MLEDILLDELKKHEDSMAPAHRHIVQLAREVARMSKDAKQTLSSITAMYVKSAHELDDLKRGAQP